MRRLVLLGALLGVGACDCSSHRREGASDRAQTTTSEPETRANEEHEESESVAPERWRALSLHSRFVSIVDDGVIFASPLGIVRKDMRGETAWTRGMPLHAESGLRAQRLGDRLLFEHARQTHVLFLETGIDAPLSAQSTEGIGSFLLLRNESECSARLTTAEGVVFGEPLLGTWLPPEGTGPEARPIAGGQERPSEGARCELRVHALGTVGGATIVVTPSLRIQLIAPGAINDEGEAEHEAPLVSHATSTITSPFQLRSISFDDRVLVYIPGGRHDVLEEQELEPARILAFSESALLFETEIPMGENCMRDPEEPIRRVSDGEVLVQACGNTALIDATGTVIFQTSVNGLARLEDEPALRFRRIGRDRGALDRDKVITLNREGETVAELSIRCEDCVVLSTPEGVVTSGENGLQGFSASGALEWESELTGDLVPHPEGLVLMQREEEGTERNLATEHGSLFHFDGSHVGDSPGAYLGALGDVALFHTEENLVARTF